MLTVALIDPMVAAQMQENPKGFEGIEVTFSGTDLEAFLAQPGLQVDVLVVSLGHLGAQPAETMDKLRAHCGAEVVVVTYSFAKRGVLRSLGKPMVRLVRAPLTLEVLKQHMVNLMVRNMFARDYSQAAPNSGSRRESPARRLASVPGPRRYSLEDLGKLQEIRSSVNCECPNHLATLVSSLYAFEDYSRNCEHRHDEDAHIHRQLSEATARARAIMEAALETLCTHENIDVNSDNN